MLEKKIEEYLCRQVKKLDGIPYKFNSPNRRSVPDRLCVFPKGVVVFVECKATGKKPTPGQLREHKRLREKYQWVEVVDSKEDVYFLIDNIKDKLDERW